MKPPRILITEDEMIVALDLERRMKKLGYDVCAVVSSGEEAVRRAAQLEPDIVLMDICLAGALDGIDAAAQIRRIHDLPVIYLTANADEKTLARARATHPASYLLKPFRERELQICVEMALLNHRLQRELKAAHDGLEQRVRERTAELAEANAALRREMEARAGAEHVIREQAALLDKARDAIHVQQLDGAVVYWNRSAERLYGISSADALGRPFDGLVGSTPVAGGVDPREATLAEGEWVGELTHMTRGGAPVVVESRWTLVRDRAGQPASILVIATDITARKSIEAQFLRAQRLESVGALASGIAHDLNNVFTPLMMAAQSLEDAPPGSYNAQIADILLSSARRGAGMVKQILLFVRGAEGERVPVQPEHLVHEVQKLLRDTLPRSIRVRTRCAPDLRPVVADATQLHQLLMNLCVNARDAMPRGGELTIEAQDAGPEDERIRRRAGASGNYLRLVVADTGSGMPPEVQARIFTPFFTTKEPGKGTGLGLSTAQSIVQAHQGFIEVESSVGAGTRFFVYLPSSDVATGVETTPESEPPAGCGEKLLVVDDEAGVREITRATLEAYGYRVVLAQDGIEAIARFAQLAGEIAGVICDQDMPLLDGPGCVQGLRRLAPAMPVLLVSGSAVRPLPRDLAGAAGIATLTKPFTKEQLLTAVHRCLHAAGADAEIPAPA